jgi:hypothetical protein
MPDNTRKGSRGDLELSRDPLSAARSRPRGRLTQPIHWAVTPAKRRGNHNACSPPVAVEHPHYVTEAAGRDRLDLASKAGVLEMALDVVETIKAQNSLEKMLAHQLAASHHASMAMTAQFNRCIENMEHHDADARERANIQGTRLAGAIARTQGTFQSGMLALQKMRTGGQQTVRVVHQHINVGEGAQAVVAGEMNTRQAAGGRRKRVGGGTRK